MGPCGETGHTGSDSSTASERADRYILWTGIGENLAYGQYGDTDGTSVIKQLVVDDGVAS